MYKLFIGCLTALLLHTDLYAQQIREFQITVPQNKFLNSKYNNLKLIDSRADTTTLGMVKVGAFDRKAKVIAKPSLQAELNKWFSVFIDQNAGKATLVLQLRRFSVDEGPQLRGYCTLRAELYKASDHQYIKVQSIDTVIALKSIDVTKELLETGAITLTDFISKSLLSEPTSGIVYSYNDILHLDSLEKRQLKLYNTAVYTDGLYTTYNSFKAQNPDKPIVVSGLDENTADINTADVKAVNAKGKLQKLNKQKIYAIVFKGQPYISTDYAYCPLNKVKDELIFTGKITRMPDNIENFGAVFGAVGVLAYGLALGSTGTYEMKIDQMNGSFIQLKKLPDPPVDYSKYRDVY